MLEAKFAFKEQKANEEFAKAIKHLEDKAENISGINVLLKSNLILCRCTFYS